MVAAYRDPDRARGRQLMTGLVASLSRGAPAALTELITLGTDAQEARRRRPGLLRSPRHQQRSDRFNGRIEHLRGSALGFRNLTNYIAYAEFRISDGMSTSGLC